MVIGPRVNMMEQEFLLGQMVVDIKENGKIAERTGRANSWAKTALSTKVSGQKASTTAGASFRPRTVKFSPEPLKVASFSVDMQAKVLN